MTVPKGTVGSWEDALHHTGAGNQYLVFTEENSDVFRDILGHSAIGVVYHPEL